MILIDTEVIKQLSAAAQSATAELESASQILSQITTHNDWGCKERETINAYIINNRKKMQDLMESSKNFTGALGQIAEEFVNTENSISDMFAGVENILRPILSIPVATTCKTPDIRIGESIAGGSGPINTGNWGGTYNPWTDGVMRTVNFQEILKGIESK